MGLSEIRRLAALARLELTSGEERLFAEQLGQLVDGCSHLRQIAVSEVISPADPGREDGDATDRPHDTLPQAIFVANAPSTADGYLTVPHIHDRSRTENEAE